MTQSVVLMTQSVVLMTQSVVLMTQSDYTGPELAQRSVAGPDPTKVNCRRPRAGCSRCATAAT